MRLTFAWYWYQLIAIAGGIIASGVYYWAYRDEDRKPDQREPYSGSRFGD